MSFCLSIGRCRGGISVNLGVRQKCGFPSLLFNTWMDWVLGNVGQVCYRASVGNTKVTDLVFVDNALLFVESMVVLVITVGGQQEEAKPLGSKFFRTQTRVQLLGHLLDDTY